MSEAGNADEAMTKWRPIADAPKDGTWQVVAHFDELCFYWWHRARFFKGQWRTGNGVVCPSYWLPLPVVENEEGRAALAALEAK